MPIVNFTITKIDAARLADELTGKLSIKSDLKIVNVAEEKLNISNQTALKFTFEFVIDYEPKFGKILLGGYLLYMPGSDENDAKTVVDTWKKTKKLDTKLMEALFNATLSKCNVKALVLSQEINLPPHIRLPVVVAEKSADKSNDKKNAYIG
ncbi:MAG: hypothetical protein PHD81_01970 [Candidatus Nanoarchaeia archaeon]|nr:hypothetical protein [Candidatus Nanoarchaeia archaeon]MDD5587856.1 hypothetical protein [Candidatus Nanoarchaeia archaeon]